MTQCNVDLDKFRIRGMPVCKTRKVYSSSPQLDYDKYHYLIV